MKQQTLRTLSLDDICGSKMPSRRTAHFQTCLLDQCVDISVPNATPCTCVMLCSSVGVEQQQITKASNNSNSSEKKGMDLLVDDVVDPIVGSFAVLNQQNLARLLADTRHFFESCNWIVVTA